MSRPEAKVILPTLLGELLRSHRQSGQSVVLASGCFDILHYGHLTYLQYAKSRGDILVVSINSDHSLRRIKGQHRPFIAEHHRALLLGALEIVDYVTIFNEDTPKVVISLLKPDIYIKGIDYKGVEIAERIEVEANGGTVEISRTDKSYSSEALGQGYMREQAQGAVKRSPLRVVKI